MHRDRNIAKLNPTRREIRAGPDRPDAFFDEDGLRGLGAGKAQRAFGARAQEAMRQIRELRSRGH
ncbi:MAG: hypothetical protein ABIO45_15925 [Burkholderiaceae bacterium]